MCELVSCIGITSVRCIWTLSLHTAVSLVMGTEDRQSPAVHHIAILVPILDIPQQQSWDLLLSTFFPESPAHPHFLELWSWSNPQTDPPFPVSKGMSVTEAGKRFLLGFDQGCIFLHLQWRNWLRRALQQPRRKDSGLMQLLIPNFLGCSWVSPVLSLTALLHAPGQRPKATHLPVALRISEVQVAGRLQGDALEHWKVVLKLSNLSLYLFLKT